jgi:hypothetical protein
MSGQCQAPNCGLKNYNQCKISEELLACSIEGENNTTGVFAVCNPNSGVDPNYTRTSAECLLGDDQISCEDIDGCKWDYTLSETGDSPLSKGCLLDDSSGSCNVLDFTTDESRYALVSGETYGCDKDHCTYVPETKARVDGSCEPSPTYAATDCSNSGVGLVKPECIDDNHKEKCSLWISSQYRILFR